VHHAILASAANGDPGNMKLFLGIGVVVLVLGVLVWVTHR